MAGTLTVACKLPAGLILQVWNMEDHDEPVFGGGVKVVKRAVKHGPAIKINGSARRMGADAPHEIRGGVGLTYGVDEDLWKRWLEQNKDEPYVKNGLVFAQPTGKPGEIGAQIRDHRTLKSGMEPLDPNNLPPEFRGKIATATSAEP
jgi:hypothetical protein